MNDETTEGPEKIESGTPAIDWADLRAQAAKLGITLSQLQQQQLEKKLRLAKKAQPRTAPVIPAE
jgi:hypothetical protein